MKTPKETIVEIKTILSNRTKKGMIDFEVTNIIDDKTKITVKTQWDLDKARHIHSMLGQAIEAAISDEMIYIFLTQKVGLDDARASAYLMDFREIRQGSKDVVNPN